MTIINEQIVLTQKYIRAGLTPAAAYAKATEVIEMRDDSRAGNPGLSEGALLAAAEQEWLAGEEAMREVVERVNRPAKLTISQEGDGLHLRRGEKALLIAGHEIGALLDHARRMLTSGRKTQKQRRIHTRRLAEGRTDSAGPWAVVGGRKVA